MSAGLTALSSVAGTDTLIGAANFSLPVWAKSIKGVTLGQVPDLPTAAETVFAQVRLSSDNLPIQPFNALASPIGGILGASGGCQFVGKAEKYDVGISTNGGELIATNMRNLATCTGANYGTVTYIVSDEGPGQAQKHVECGTLTTDTAINAENPGTQYSISGARNIVELIGATGPTTIATSEGYVGRIRYTSSEFAGLNNADLTLNAVGGGLATLSIAFIDGVSRQKCNIPIQQVSQCNIVDNFRIISSANIGAAVGWVSGVVYEV